MGVPPSHPPRGSLPAGFFRPGRVRARRRRPSVGSAARPTRPASTPRQRAARRPIDGIVPRWPTHRPHVLTGVKAASLTRRPATGGFGLDAGSARAPQRAIVRRCRTWTLPHTDRAVAGPLRRDSGAAQLFVSRRRVSLPAGPQERSRTVGRGSHPKDRSGRVGPAKQVDGRGRPCAAGRRGPPGAHHPRRPSGPARAASTAGPNRRGARRISVRGSRGRRPPPAQCRTLGKLAPDIQRMSGASLRFL